MKPRVTGALLSVSDADVAEVRSVVDRFEDTDFLRSRRIRNVFQPPLELSRDEFWRVLLGCLLTTQQRSTRGSPVHLFLELNPFPMTLSVCASKASAQTFVLETIKNFGGIRRGVTISKQAAENFERLSQGLWKETEDWFRRLAVQRTRGPQNGDGVLEREAANWADKSFAGLGPKQSRNLWQWLGLTRFEIPLDSRVTEWVSENLTVRVDARRLGQLKYYESVLDVLLAICEKAEVLPCELDAAAFDFEDLGLGNNRVRSTTESGFVNPHGQITIRNTGLPGTDHNQYVYQLGCSKCGHVYGANGSDLHERKCPVCQGGCPGIPFSQGGPNG